MFLAAIGLPELLPPVALIAVVGALLYGAYRRRQPDYGSKPAATDDDGSAETSA